MAGLRVGEWEVTVAGQPPRRLCIIQPDALLRIRHHGGNCTRLVVAEGRRSVTVQYSCPGAGWGRTTLRVSSPVVVQIATQGIAGHAPFDDQASAQRIGDCAARIAAR